MRSGNMVPTQRRELAESVFPSCSPIGIFALPIGCNIDLFRIGISSSTPMKVPHSPFPL
jgi:hypothetical protein